jgi:hypothetical protein
VTLCRRAGFRHILLRGDTDFTQTWKLDEWDEPGDITFLFAADASPGLVARAREIPAADWRRLGRPAKYQVKTEPRARPDNVKEQIVREKGYKNLVLQWEEGIASNAKADGAQDGVQNLRRWPDPAAMPDHQGRPTPDLPAAVMEPLDWIVAPIGRGDAPANAMLRQPTGCQGKDALIRRGVVLETDQHTRTCSV